MLLAQDASGVVAQVAHHRLDDIGAVNLQQNVGSTLEVEAERQGARVRPCRQVRVERLAGGRAEHARHDEQNRHDDHTDDGDDLPGRET